MASYQIQTEWDQLGFSSLYALNRWVWTHNLDPKKVKVSVTYELAEEDWNQDLEKDEKDVDRSRNTV